MTNPFENRDLTARLKWPALSWSSFNTFVNYSKDEWYVRYVLGIETTVNPSMLAGRIVGERWATDPSYLPEVSPRPEEFETELTATWCGIPLVGHLDGLSMKHEYKRLYELKTSMSDKTWTSKSVGLHRQLDFYALLLWLNYKIRPEDLHIQLIYVPVQMTGSFEVVRTDAPPRLINTSRTLAQVLRFAANLKGVYAEMEKFVAAKELSTGTLL